MDCEHSKALAGLGGQDLPKQECSCQSGWVNVYGCCAIVVSHLCGRLDASFTTF
jgi:hypothetical protein